jgi:large subunit ribosomal protein L7Ae
MGANYSKVEIPKALTDKALEIIEIARNTGKIKKGMNEATKIVERGKAKLIVVANDINPPEIVMHLPPLCEEKGAIFIVACSKIELGSVAGLEVPTSAIAVIDAGEAKKQLKELTDEMARLKK